jgi:predicted flap endonuclease-1-like 5' DNA nuclease
MSVAAIFTVTFIIFVGITLLVPSFPPAQSLYEIVRIPQTSLSLGGISIATLLNGITNGFFWTIIATTAYGLIRLTRQAEKRNPLQPMPIAPNLNPPPPKNTLVDSWVSKIPPTLTVPPAKPLFMVPHGTVRKDLTRKRVAREPVGKEIDIEMIEGIEPVCSGLLRNSGINTVSDLLRVGATERGRHRLANDVGVSYKTMLKWVHRGDLLRVNGVGKKYSALLESAGINTVTDLSTESPRCICQKLKDVNRERNIVGRPPPYKTIEIWVCNAKNLEPIIVE